MIKIEDSHRCCGCTACAAVCGHEAITMHPDSEGFMYPRINAQKCIDCGLCEKVCPLINRNTEKPYKYPLSIFGLKNLDLAIRNASSSGGVFHEIAANALSHGGIVYGATFDETFRVVHCGEVTPDDVQRFRGSKYVQSDLRGIFCDIRKQLKQGGYVLFSGTPCQVEGLKNSLIKDYDNLTTIDILCHGVASPRLFADYVDFIRKHSFSSLSNIFMKDKTFGWGYQNLRLYFQNGTSEFNTPLANLWNKIYYSHLAHRPSCHECPFTNLQRAGDLTIGDFWGIEKTHPEFNDALGTSLLMINTKKGERIWNEIRHRFESVESDRTECLQPVLLRPVEEPRERKAFWDDYFSSGFAKAVSRTYSIGQLTLLKNKLYSIRNILKAKLWNH